MSMEMNLVPRLTRAVTLAITLAAILAGSANAQIPASMPDTAAARREGADAARRDKLPEYYLGGFLGIPWTIGAATSIAGGTKPVATMFIGPALTIFMGTSEFGHADRPLPNRLQLAIGNHDSAYVVAFKHGYNATLNARRRKATLVGGAIGAAFLVGLVYSLSTITVD